MGEGIVGNQSKLLVMTALAAHVCSAAEFAVTRADAADAGPGLVGPPTRFMVDPMRYDPQKRADRMTRRPGPVSRQSYVDYIYEDSTYGPKSIRTGPDRGQYGVRHAFPALVHYDATGDAELGAGIKKTLAFYEAAIRKQVQEKKWHSKYMHDPTLLCMFRRVFQAHDDWSADDEVWFREVFLFLCRTVHVWGTEPTFWRGPMHRSTGEAIMKLLAVTMYPDIPEAAEWRRYAELQWNDWWRFRDTPINDTGYFYGQAFPMILGAHLLNHGEVFTDPAMRAFWERQIHMTTPDGAVAPFGPSSGWNAAAGERLMALEAVAAYTGDGRYRFVAHRMFDYLLYQQAPNRSHHMLDHFGQLGVALAYFLADDDVKPVQPDAGSVVLHHKETLRVKGKEGAVHYLEDLDPDPLKAQICCGLLCTDNVLPFKLCLRSGWNPGDMYMLVDLFPRHEPMNPTGIVGFVRHNSVFTHGMNSKSVTDWMNMFEVTDLSGTAPLVGNDNPHTRDAYYMDVTVPVCEDRKRATFARVEVNDYGGFPMSHRREFLFVKNRFCVIRDTATFRARFLARIGPNWRTQNIGPQLGDHWANTFFSAPYSNDIALNHAQMDLLVYHASRPGRQLLIADDTHDVRRLTMPYTLQYTWQGIVQPDQPYVFTHLLAPALPDRRTVRSNAPGAMSQEELYGQYLANRVEVVVETDTQSVWRIGPEQENTEWIVLNTLGEPIALSGLETDARQLYLDVSEGKVVSAFVLGASYVKVGDAELFRGDTRQDWER